MRAAPRASEEVRKCGILGTGGIVRCRKPTSCLLPLGVKPARINDFGPNPARPEDLQYLPRGDDGDHAISIKGSWSPCLGKKFPPAREPIPVLGERDKPWEAPRPGQSVRGARMGGCPTPCSPPA